MEQAWPHPAVRVERRAVDESESRRANGPDWDRYADEYQATHGPFLGDIGFLWGPEGLTEDVAGVLGPLADRDVLELGCGASQCSRWVATQGGRPVGLDLSYRQLQHSRRIDEQTGVPVPVLQGTATQRPFADDTFHVVFCSFGALQFVADLDDAVGEAARVLRPGGRFAFSITHPTRWMFPDDPGEVAYVEHHRTLGDWVRVLAAHRFALVDLVEPQWPAAHDRVWGGWSRTRGLLTPGTAIFAARLLPPDPA